MANVLELEVHQIGEVHRDVWCERCLLHSAISARFVMVSTSTLCTMRRWIQFVCVRCDHSWTA